MEGDKTTGITLMRMETGLDTGPIIAKEELMIGADDAGALDDRLEVIVGELALVRDEGAAVVVAGQYWSVIVVQCFPEGLVGQMSQGEDNAGFFHFLQQSGTLIGEAAFGSGAVCVGANAVVG